MNVWGKKAMLTGFKARQDIQKAKELKAAKEAEASAGSELNLLQEAVQGVLNENTHRVYIDDYPYLVEFKLPNGLDITALQQALSEKKIQLLNNKSVGVEILVHTFGLLPSSETTFEVFYKPLPRMRM